MLRRAFLFGAGAAALVAAARADLPRPWEPPLDLRPLERPVGFRRLASGGPGSAAADPLFGLSGTSAAAGTWPDLCATLFGPEPWRGGAVPVAMFSDYNCAYCRVLAGRLAEIEAGADVRLRRHELPLLGPASEQAARAALAADRQGGHRALHDRLMKTSFQPTATYLRSVAEGIGIDPEQMIADMHDEPVASRLEVSRRLADLFGIAATPAMVVGRTLVAGAVSQRTLRRLVALEAAEGPSQCV